MHRPEYLVIHGIAYRFLREVADRLPDGELGWLAERRPWRTNAFKQMDTYREVGRLSNGTLVAVIGAFRRDRGSWASLRVVEVAEKRKVRA
jgi:hypothetical protein